MQIIAGLQRHVPLEHMQNRLVVVVLNLKTAKLAGEVSEGMILASVHKGDHYKHGELVRPLEPPGNRLPSLCLSCDNSSPSWQVGMPATQVRQVWGMLCMCRAASLCANIPKNSSTGRRSCLIWQSWGQLLHLMGCLWLPTLVP